MSNTGSPTFSAPLLGGMSVALAGVVVLAAASISAYNTSEYVSEALQAEGTVVALDAGRTRPRVQFVAAPGNTVEFVAGGWSFHEIGDLVNVRFLEHDARGTAELDEVGSLWVTAVATAALGVSVLLTGVIMTLRFRNGSPAR